MLYRIENLLKVIKEQLIQNDTILELVKKKDQNKFKSCLAKQFDDIAFENLVAFEFKSNRNSLLCKVEKKKTSEEVKERIKNLLGDSESNSNLFNVVELPSKVNEINNFKIVLSNEKNSNGKFANQVIYEEIGRQNKENKDDRIFMEPFLPKYSRQFSYQLNLFAKSMRDNGKRFGMNIYTRIRTDFRNNSIDLYVKGRKDEEYTPVLESKQFNYFCKDKARMVENLKQWKLLDKKRFIKSMMIEI